AADLLLQAEFVAAHHRAEDDGAAAELRRAQAALAGAAGALLPPRLLGGALDVADALGLVGAGTALGELPVDHARQDVAAHRDTEHALVELDLADILVVEVLDLELHLTRLPPAAPRPLRPRAQPAPPAPGGSPPGRAAPSAPRASPHRTPAHSRQRCPAPRRAA